MAGANDSEVNLGLLMGESGACLPCQYLTNRDVVVLVVTARQSVLHVY